MRITSWIGWSSFVLLIVCGCARNKNAVSSSVNDTPSATATSPYEKLAKQFEEPDEFEKLVTGQNDASWTDKLKGMTASFSSKVTPKPSVKPASDPISLASGIPKLGPEVYYSAGVLAEERHKLDQAVVEYRRALDAEPNYLPALLAIARLFDQRGERSAALKVLADARKAHPNHPAPLNAMGLIAASQGNAAQAEQYLAEAVRRAPKDVRYRNNLANVLVRAGKVDAAWQTLSAVHTPAVARYNVAFLLYQNGRTSEAVGQLEEALKLQPNLSAAVVLKQKLLTTQGGGSSRPANGSPQANVTRAPQNSPYRSTEGASVSGSKEQPRHLPVVR